MTTSLTILISLLGLLLVMVGTRILLKLYSRAHTRDSWTPILLMFIGGGVLTTAGPNMIASLFGDSSSIDNHTIFLGPEWAIIAASAVVALAVLENTRTRARELAAR